MLKAIIIGIAGATVAAPFLALSAAIYISQGHWNPAYVIASCIFVYLAMAVTIGILQWRSEHRA